MGDIEQTIEEQPDSPGAHAPGEGAQLPDKGETLASVTAPETEPATSQAGSDAGVGAAAADGPVDGDATELEGDLDELVKTAAQRDEYLALAQRTQADFENYRKRVARESANAQGRGVASLAKELLPALDNLDRALEEAGTAAAAGGGGRDNPLLEGVRLVRSELGAALARMGIESFSPVGETFDPALHEAMATTEQPDDGADSGTVVEVYQRGYRLGENILRPARVVVAA
jgi:molecular chaperone GrpE